MARKRDYNAEERRRNELARQRGYSSRAQQRRAIETGKRESLAPNRLRNPRTIEAQKFLIGERTKGIETKGTILPTFGNRVSDVQRAEDWSDLFARSSAAKYDPDNRPSGMTKAAYTDAYLAAFVRGDERYVEVRRRGGSDALRRWFVDIAGYLTADEYESRYGTREKG